MKKTKEADTKGGRNGLKRHRGTERDSGRNVNSVAVCCMGVCELAVSECAYMRDVCVCVCVRVRV